MITWREYEEKRIHRFSYNKEHILLTVDHTALSAMAPAHPSRTSFPFLSLVSKIQSVLLIYWFPRGSSALYPQPVSPSE